MEFLIALPSCLRKSHCNRIASHFLHLSVLGLYGNDDLHNGLVQVFNSGKQLNRLFFSVRNQVRA